MCIIDNAQNMLILHPDQLISSTVVADSFSCTRRAVLQDRVKATSDASPALVYGTLLHEIFQEALMANKWDLAFLTNATDTAIKKHMEELYTIKVQIPNAREHLLSKVKELRYWAEAFISSYPKDAGIVKGRNGEKITMCISKLLDVEEHVWSPMYGLKGNIDATVQVTMRAGIDRRTLTVPLELKTGRNVSENHQAQTVLYNLLLSDRYDIDIVYGLLYYMETSQMFRIPAIRHELRHMIMQRNQLACHVRERNVQLPPMKRSKNMCGKCYAQASCFVYHKLADDGDGETSGMADKFDNVVKHLTPEHKDFFLKWENLLTKEEKESQKLRRELWTLVSSEREKLGRCFGNVIIEEGSASEDKETPKINRFHYTFIKENAAPGFSFMDSQLALGEPIVVSDEQGHFALALGYITAVRKQRISVAVDRRLHNARIRQPGFDEVDNQVFASIMEVAHEGATPAASQGKIKLPPVRYRLDKDEFSNGMSLVRNNLVQVMTTSAPGANEIRKRVVDLVPPAFKMVATQYTIADKDSLNIDQKRAIEKVMSAKDYALVLGMPGTGKTTTIAHIIRALVAQKKSVLLTSYTHTAVDNILLKLKTDGTNILRLGAPAKVHSEVRDFAILAGQRDTSATFESIHAAWHDTPIVATTCLGISHPLFAERSFDYCIVDEASQITLPICLGPIRMAKTFILVGDHNQLPPLVQNDEARRGGLDVSLFKLLSDAHPGAVASLTHQYRMAEDIMELSSRLIYHGELKCGTDAVRYRALIVPNMPALRRHHPHDAASLARLASPRAACVGNPGACWLAHLLHPQQRAVFVNTDRVPGACEEAKGNRIVNQAEARVVAQLVEALLTVGVAPEDVGVMTHYRSQLALLKYALRGSPQVEMHTADRFQGRDKEVVVLSLVRSNDAHSIGELLRDWRRINVAFTRAKSKLLIIGSRSTLKGSASDGGGEEGEGKMLARFVALMEERDWVYDLPPDALDSHLFEASGGTQGGSPGKRSQVGSSPVRKSPVRRSPKKGLFDGPGGKENKAPLKRTGISEKMLLKGKPILRDILNDMTGGIY
jgi:DNA replication ATP-dependent helicase Dna2